MKRVLLDLNQAEFQDQLLALPADETARLFSALRKIRQLSWEQLYRDHGLHWEAVRSRIGPQGERVYSFRVTQKMRAVGYRDGDALRLVSLHPDHDSAYR